MRVKICGLKSESDINIIVEAGADAAGFLVGQLHASPDFILPTTAARLVAKLPPYITPVLVTQLTQANEILDLVAKSEIRTIQLHSILDLKEIKILRSKLYASDKIIMAVNPEKQNFKEQISLYFSYIDAILLDTCDPSTGEMGGTGITHDWDLSAKVIEECCLPVILAGGLNPENIETAIMKVKPFGVDANSCLKNINNERDLKLCREFVLRSKQAELKIKKCTC